VLRSGGGYAEEIVLDAAAVVPIPAAMDFITAAAFPVAYGTSHFALTHRGHLQPGDARLRDRAHRPALSKLRLSGRRQCRCFE
jgi:NADPH:quinone reductase-like Zn-dependent oxidoreductase